MSLFPDAPVLTGSLVELQPLSLDHVADLTAAVAEDRASFGFTLVPRPEDVASYVTGQLSRAGLTPFAQIRTSDRRAIGCTGYWDLRTWPRSDALRAIEIGFTWLASSAQGSGINAEAKLLLMSYAFEELGVVRVDLKTDARNVRCRTALERMGIPFEGVLRNWSMSWAPGEDGKLRDSAMFAVVAEDWPSVRSRLEHRIAALRATAVDAPAARA
jgi:N-acetyltransferase